MATSVGVKELRLPALTSEDVEVPVVGYATDPTTQTWQAAVSATNSLLENGSPPASAYSATTVVNDGAAAAPDYRVKVRVAGLPVGTYGVWVRVVGAAGASPVRYAGRIVLY